MNTYLSWPSMDLLYLYYECVQMCAKSVCSVRGYLAIVGNWTYPFICIALVSSSNHGYAS
jgi:hypothetical protein